jgi:hypothetical protein
VYSCHRKLAFRKASITYIDEFFVDSLLFGGVYDRSRWH